MPNPPINLTEALSQAGRLAKKGEHGKARQLYKAILAKHPGHKKASKALRALDGATLRLTPFDQDRLRQVEGLLAAGKVDAAVSSGRRLMREFPKLAFLPNIIGIAEARRGRLDDAVKLLQKATTLDPAFQPAWINLTTVLRLDGQYQAALTSAERAVSLDPALADAHVNLGKCLGDVGQTDAALASFNSALRLKADLVTAHDGICGLHEKENRISDLRAAVEAALAACRPDQAVITFRKGQLELREKDFSAARATLETIPAAALPPEMRATRAEHLGKACDRLGHWSAAFDYFSEANEFAQQRAVTRGVARNSFLEALARSEAALDATAPPDWPREADREKPAFLVGFPRSGTTLLDTILRSHPDISVIEEMPLVENLAARLGGAVGIAELDRLTTREIEGQARRYWAEARKYLDAETPVVIDKMPLNMAQAVLIARIFPGAKFILALRHPADCVLSGFMQTFRSNPAMDNFLTLKGSADLYDQAMRYWCKCAEKLDLDVQEIRYEALISDLRGATEPVLNFLGCDWTDAVENYRQTAETRGRIHTPSYSQVSQGLYKTAAGRWESYREQLAPVMDRLAPWIAHWGYGE